MELVDSDSEDEQQNEIVTRISLKLARQHRKRVPRYCEDVVNKYYDLEFKRLFRLSRVTVDTIVARFEASPFYPGAIGRRPQISVEKKKACLVVPSWASMEHIFTG
ncbi:hypothetical protein HPB49_007042 [Dermacentor silvarum]|uniref:Uncharacterized protein n=1 Tax=Dermacentor silvarum TaxID=543639 RepID=A0ACB8DBQ0_DERSI|nr:hypothetical protein HPB49_007042 [Dermacentor silvarum]